MKLLVLAQVPPPLHGQSAMVRTLVEGLRDDPDITILHVNPRLSRDSADIGAWRPGKVWALLGACRRALALRLRHGPMTLYYVPSPGRRGALYRDWVVMLLCRPWFHSLVLHWHAVGLGAWLATTATAPERWLTRLLLGRAGLALVLAPELAGDAQALAPRRVMVVPNGVPDPGSADPRPARAAGERSRVLFLGLGSRAKGLFAALDGVAIAEQAAPGTFHLTVAGPFAGAAEEREFHAQAARLGPAVVTYVGPVDGQAKDALLAAADVFCFPTAYAHEGQPLTVIEALAHDLPIVTTRWRAIPGLLPAESVWFVEPGKPDQIAEALLAARRAGPARGALRRHYLGHWTVAQHLAALKVALLSVDRP